MAQSNEHAKPTEFDAYRGSYSQTVNDAIAFSGLKVDYFTRVKASYLLDLVADTVVDPGKARLLDVGCGVGNFHPLLGGSVGSLSGVDVSSGCLEEAARANPSVDYRHFDGTQLPFDDDSFDVAFAVCVFHHIPLDQRAALARDVRRVLRPGGSFVIFEHNPWNPLTRWVVDRCPFDADAVLLPPADAEQLLGGAGFSALSTQHILTVPPSGSMLRGLDRLAGRLPFGAQYYTRGRV